MKMAKKSERKEQKEKNTETKSHTFCLCRHDNRMTGCSFEVVKQQVMPAIIE
jgi:hypothetical protein